jgi:hypothetical protein
VEYGLSREVLMETLLLLLPVAVLLGLGWTNFPVLTGVFLVYTAAFAVPGLLKRKKELSAPRD